MRVPLVSIALAFAVVGCASNEASVSTTTSVETSPTSTSVVSTTSLPEPTTTSTTAPATASTTPEIDVEFVDGDVVGPDVLEVELGESVDIWIRSDLDDEVHVHGYDLVYELGAGEPFHLSFVADVPGIFEVEVHTGHTHLFDIEVRG